MISRKNVTWILPFALFFVCLVTATAQRNTAGRGDPSECKLVFVGAGIGSLYSAYRLAVETNTISASDICIFEALDRPGGRIYSVKGVVPGFEDYTVDLGAYRYVHLYH